MATERLSKGDQGTITFSETGTYHYYCTIHPYMEAVLTVR